MDYAKLKSEITGDPLGRDYAGMTAQQAADSLNAADRQQIVPVTMRSVLRWSARHDAIYQLQQGVASGTKDKRRLCDAALSMIQSPHVPDLDLADPEIAGMFTALVIRGVFTQAQADDLVAMATKMVSRAEELGLPFTGAHHVEYARSL